MFVYARARTRTNFIIMMSRAINLLDRLKLVWMMNGWMTMEYGDTIHQIILIIMQTNHPELWTHTHTINANGDNNCRWNFDLLRFDCVNENAQVKKNEFRPIMQWMYEGPKSYLLFYWNRCTIHKMKMGQSVNGNAMICERERTQPHHSTMSVKLQVPPVCA